MSDQNLLLAKAQNVATHLARVNKAVADFNEKMGEAHKAHAAKVCELHKVHCEDLHKATSQLKKMLGIDSDIYGQGEAKPTDLQAVGTENIQHFKASGSEPLAALPADVMTKAEMIAMLDVYTKSLVSALGGIEETPGDVSQYAKGVGDRSQLAPMQRQSTQVSKAGDGTGPTAVATSAHAANPSPELAKRALEGDTSALLEMFKSARPAEIPVTLSEPLSKIH